MLYIDISDQADLPAIYSVCCTLQRKHAWIMHASPEPVTACDCMFYNCYTGLHGVAGG